MIWSNLEVVINFGCKHNQIIRYWNLQMENYTDKTIWLILWQRVIYTLTIKFQVEVLNKKLSFFVKLQILHKNNWTEEKLIIKSEDCSKIWLVRKF